MRAPPPKRELADDDVLYRFLRPGVWGPGTGEVYEDAFRDQHESLSLYVARRVSPRGVMARFAAMKPFRERYGNIAPEDLWDLGYGVARVTARALLKDIGLSPKPDGDGHHFGKSGHADFPGGQEKATLISAVAEPLRREEIFGEGSAQ